VLELGILQLLKCFKTAETNRRPPKEIDHEKVIPQKLINRQKTIDR